MRVIDAHRSGNDHAKVIVKGAQLREQLPIKIFTGVKEID
jgi:hypothetical protein